MNPEIKAEFQIKSDYRSNEEITYILGIAPTKEIKKNELIKGSKIKMTKNLWAFSIENPIESLDICDFILPLLVSLERKKEAILELSHEDGIHCVIECPIYIHDQTPIMSLSTEVIHRIYELNTEIDFDIYLC
jgi:hypothetical protein